MSTLSVAVMAHPSRRDHVLGHYNEMFNQAGDMGRAVYLFVDEYSEGVWFNNRRCWLAYEPDASHHLVLQDDALLCKDLVPGLEAALSEIPQDVPVAAFNGAPYIKSAAKQGSSWAVSGAVSYGVALILPTFIIEDMMCWIDKHVRPSAVGDDERVMLYTIHQGMKWWSTCPTLVDHLGGAVSLVVKAQDGRRVLTPRRSKMFLGAEKSALHDVDWSKGAKKPRSYRDPPAYSGELLENCRRRNLY